MVLCVEYLHTLHLSEIHARVEEAMLLIIVSE